MFGKLKAGAALLLSASVLYAQNEPATSNKDVSFYEQHRQQTLQVNELAGRIAAPADARRVVYLLAESFGQTLPKKLGSRRFLDRLAAAEYQSATDPARRIPEQRIADAWNAYVHEIGAPDESLVSVAEIHNLRDALYASAKVLWRPQRETLLAIPSLYATKPDGTLDTNCRALESLRIAWDLANEHDNLIDARERVQKGLLFSDLVKSDREGHTEERSYVAVRVRAPNPVQIARMNYVRDHGEKQYREVVERLAFAILSDNR